MFLFVRLCSVRGLGTSLTFRSTKFKMSAEEDTELRDLVAQSLESKGVLGKIRVRINVCGKSHLSVLWSDRFPVKDRRDLSLTRRLIELKTIHNINRSFSYLIWSINPLSLMLKSKLYTVKYDENYFSLFSSMNWIKIVIKESENIWFIHWLYW